MVIFVFSSLSLFCMESLAQLSAVISSGEAKLSLLNSIFFFILMLFLGNCFVPLKELHYSLQILSSLSFLKYGFESIILIIYGFDRCSEDQISTVLYSLGIKTQDFWPNIIILIILCFFYKFITLFALITRNRMSHAKKYGNFQANIVFNNKIIQKPF